MGATKPALPSSFNYFTPNDLNMNFATTVNSHPTIAKGDLDTILLSQVISPQGITKVNFTPTSVGKILTAINKLSAKMMGHDAISQQMLK